MSSHTWSHGYYAHALYTCGFYREMAPNWLDFAALVKGHRPTRREGQPFRYLELGSGMGLHLCLLAAAYPEGEFVGVDFHVDQIAHSRRLQQQLGVTNVSFIHADFLTLADPSNAVSLTNAEILVPQSFNYVACHGVFTWVPASVQDALLDLASRYLSIGGLLYLSYNINPGWLPGSIFQHLAEGERARSSSAQPLEAYRRAAELLGSLIGPSPEQSSPLGAQQPSLRQVLADAATADPTYLLHEYANPNWQSVWVDELHPRLLGHQLRHLGSATLPELFRELLPPFLRTLVEAEPEGPRQELCIDLGLCRRFRRDLFVYGFDSLVQAEYTRRIAQLRVKRLSSLALDPISFATSFGEIGGDPAVFATIDAALSQGPDCVGRLSAACGREPAGMLALLALGLHGGQLALDRPSTAPCPALSINRSLLDAIALGAPFHFVAAPSTGSALPLQLQEAILLQMWLAGVSPEGWSEGLLRALEALDQKLRATLQGVDNEPEADQQGLAEKAIHDFLSVRLPVLCAAGVVANGPA